ncbi:Zinc finger and SCAN domain-containing protein 2 [Halotydeus destructor]|nr:Zinc finger and SCAN domain-containing protein 2 [Halotydeus destructor]
MNQGNAMSQMYSTGGASLTNLTGMGHAANQQPVPLALDTKKPKRGRPADSGGHEGTTSDPSLLSCLICGKNFVSLGRLKSHEKTHSKSRPFQCVDCGKTFTVRYSLICHTRTHTRERPYNCAICGSRFSQASSLKTHQIYKHTKDFPYKCRHCGRGFISPGQRHEHINRAHLKIASATGPKGRKARAASDGLSSPTMTTTSVQTQLSLPPGPVY